MVLLKFLGSFVNYSSIPDSLGLVNRRGVGDEDCVYIINSPYWEQREEHGLYMGIIFHNPICRPTWDSESFPLCGHIRFADFAAEVCPLTSANFHF